jgi:uncharacterized Tic20 family protein
MGYCVSCAKDVKAAKFCPTCGRQLLTTAELKAEASAAEQPVEAARGRSNLAMWAHLAPILGGVVAIWLFVAAFLLWLPGMLVRNSATATDFEKRHGTESMNFQLTMLIFTVIGAVFSIFTFGIGLLIVVPGAIALAIAALIFMVMGSVAANNGREFRYPLSIRFVK